jgi:hypothetical protein
VLCEGDDGISFGAADPRFRLSLTASSRRCSTRASGTGRKTPTS